MTKGVNIAAIEKATGKTWDEWLEFLTNHEAQAFSHKDIAQLVSEKGGVSGWWAQSISVAYEQEINRRVPGQGNDGKFQVSVSKTYLGSKEEALAKWVALTKKDKTFNEVSIARPATTSQGKTFVYWHCGLEDGSRLSMNIYEKEKAKAVIGLEHGNLLTNAEIESWRAYWKSLLSKLS